MAADKTIARDAAALRRFLLRLFTESVEDLLPEKLIARHWSEIVARVPALEAPPPEPGRNIIIGYGKAAAALAAALAPRLAGKTFGLVAVPAGYGEAFQSALARVGVETVTAGHPVPDASSVAGAEKALALARSAGSRDRVFFLATGGGSATMAAPIPPLTLAQKQAIVRHLVLSGAPIGDINLARRHLSRVKGGRLAAAAQRAGLRVSLVISDVTGDDPALVASGPSIWTRPDPERARRILARWRAPEQAAWEAALSGAREEEAPAAHTAGALAADPVIILARGRDLIARAAECAQKAGVHTINLGDGLSGDAAAVGRAHAAQALALRARETRPVVILSGGELTVRVRHGDAKGGPNLTYLAAMLQELRGAAGIAALAADTDGRDGSSGCAGGVITPASWRCLKEKGWTVEEFLARDESAALMAGLGATIEGPPIPLNVNDFRAVLVVPGNGRTRRQG